MYVCSMTKLQEEFHTKCKEEYAINLLRRAMIRVANALCEKYRYKTIITGESLGQVASQTIESMTVVGNVVKDIQIKIILNQVFACISSSFSQRSSASSGRTSASLVLLA